MEMSNVDYSPHAFFIGPFDKSNSEFQVYPKFQIILKYKNIYKVAIVTGM